MLYDDKCKMCHRFARVVDTLSGGRLSIIGHYTQEGIRIRKQVLDDAATEMFWLITKQAAYGGRAALIPLIRSIFTTKNGLGMVNDNPVCSDECNVFLRSYSLFSRSRRIPFDDDNTIQSI